MKDQGHLKTWLSRARAPHASDGTNVETSERDIGRRQLSHIEFTRPADTDGEKLGGQRQTDRHIDRGEREREREEARDRQIDT